MPNLTPWYPSEIKPKRIGWYSCKNGSPVSVDYNVGYWWDGWNWRVSYQSGSMLAITQEKSWRGLAKP